MTVVDQQRRRESCRTSCIPLHEGGGVSFEHLGKQCIWGGPEGAGGSGPGGGEERRVTMMDGMNLHDSDDGRGLLIPIPIFDEAELRGSEMGVVSGEGGREVEC